MVVGVFVVGAVVDAVDEVDEWRVLLLLPLLLLFVELFLGELGDNDSV
jgi:hypothetical protein